MKLKTRIITIFSCWTENQELEFKPKTKKNLGFKMGQIQTFQKIVTVHHKVVLLSIRQPFFDYRSPARQKFLLAFHQVFRLFYVIFYQ